MEDKEDKDKGGGGDRAMDQQAEVMAVVAVPPDGGWGWVIVAASFMCNLIVDGIVFSFGVFLDEIAKDLGASKTEVTIAGSLLSGVYMIIGMSSIYLFHYR